MGAVAKSLNINLSQPREETLSICYLVCDGNAYHGVLDQTFTGKIVISEAMLPSVRLVACMIAASRHDFSQGSPAQFTEEADWFAARILVMKARSFHLDVSLLDMLALANERAEAFARKHQLTFKPAIAHLSLHAGRPQEMLIIKTALEIDDIPRKDDLVSNSQKLNQKMGSVF